MAIGARSLINVPVTERGEAVALVFVHDAQPRAWSRREQGLVGEFAERLRTAMERLRAEAELGDSESRYRTLFESVEQGFCVFDMLFDDGGRPVDYTFVKINPAFEAQTGLRHAVGRRMSELVPGHEQRWYDLYGTVALTGTPLRIEEHARALGRWFEVHAYRVGAPGQRRVDGLPPARVDPNQLEMAILNLAVNARDAMPDGGTLRLSVSAASVGADNDAGVKPGGYLRLSVADTGTGMDEDTLRRAVEPFFSTKGVGKGTGLGLSMAHGLASQLGGALTIRSAPGVGTTIELWLPESGEWMQAQDPAPDPAAVTNASGVALLVDDEELVRLSTADMLAELGYAVVEAASAEQALKLVGGGLKPDLLVTDHLMPGITGTELARAVRGRMASTKVLVVSGYAEAEGIDPDLPRLTKPFRSVDLAERLAALS